MTLEDADKIDIVVKSKTGGVMLIISDGGITTDPQERFQKLGKKLKTYVGFVISDDFKRQFPNVKPKDVMIVVFCENEPTEQMKQISEVMPRGDIENAISVVYQVTK